MPCGLRAIQLCGRCTSYSVNRLPSLCDDKSAIVTKLDTAQRKWNSQHQPPRPWNTWLGYIAGASAELSIFLLLVALRPLFPTFQAEDCRRLANPNSAIGNGSAMDCLGDGFAPDDYPVWTCARRSDSSNSSSLGSCGAFISVVDTVAIGRCELVGWAVQPWCLLKLVLFYAIVSAFLTIGIFRPARLSGFPQFDPSQPT